MSHNEQHVDAHGRTRISCRRQPVVRPRRSVNRNVGAAARLMLTILSVMGVFGAVFVAPAAAAPFTLASLVITPASGSVRAGTAQTYAVRGLDQDGKDLGNLTRETTFSIEPNGSCAGNTCSATRAGEHKVTGLVTVPRASSAVPRSTGP
jgi:hypothetical protein